MVAQTLSSGYLCSGPASGERQFDHTSVERVRPDLLEVFFPRRAPEGFFVYPLCHVHCDPWHSVFPFEDREMVFIPSVAMCLAPMKRFVLPKGLYGESSGQNLCRLGVSCVQAVCWTSYGPGDGFCPFQRYRINVPDSSEWHFRMCFGLRNAQSSVISSQRKPEESDAMLFSKNAYGSACVAFAFGL